MKRMSAWLVVFGLLLSLLSLHPSAAHAQANCVLSGYIHVTNADTGEELGFVSNVWNDFGEYGVTTNANQRLLVSFPVSPQFSITAVNGPDSQFPYVGAIQGFASTSPDLGVGSRNYVYVGGTVETPVGATPAVLPNAYTNATGIPQTVESAIWSLSASNEFTAQWVNSDGTKPATYSMYYTPESALFLTGDPSAWRSTLVPAVTLTFILVDDTCSAPAQINALISLVQSFQLQKGTETSLLAKLNATLTAVNSDDTVSACTAMDDFIAYVQAQSGKKLTVEQANQLLDAATAIRATLGC
jgi:hypothetical protein